MLFLLTGTVGAQVVSFVALPVLSRIYTPEAFGYFSVILAVSGILSPVATLQFEAAAMLPPRIETVRAIVWLAISASSVISVLTFLGLQLFATMGWFNLDQFPGIEVWVGVFVALSGAFAILSQLALRKRQYRLVAQRSFIRSVLTACAQLGIGWLIGSSVGLLVGAIIGSLGGLAILWRTTREYLSFPQRTIFRATAKEYWRFPVVFAPSVLLNSLGLQAPLIFFTATFGLGVGGQLGMAERIVGVPVALIGGAVTQTLNAEVARQIRQGKQDFTSIFKRFSVMLTGAGLSVGLGGVLLGGVFVPVLLGSNWVTAGMFVQILAITASIRLVASPLSTFLLLFQKSAAHIALDLIRIVLVGLAMLITLAMAVQPAQAIGIVYSALSLTYLLTWVYLWQLVRSEAIRGS